LHEGLLVEFIGKSWQLKQGLGTLCLPPEQTLGVLALGDILNCATKTYNPSVVIA
jgi:hypothetical protein